MKKYILISVMLAMYVACYGQTAIKVRPEASTYADSAKVADTAKTLQGKDTTAIQTDYRGDIADSTDWYTDGDDTVRTKSDNPVSVSNARIDNISIGNRFNIVIDNINLNDKTFDSIDANNIESDVIKATDTVGILSDDGTFVFWQADGTATYSLYLDTDTIKLYNHVNSDIHAKYLPGGNTAFNDTVKAVGFVATGTGTAYADYVFEKGYELLSWDKQVEYWQDKKALPSLYNKGMSKKGISLSDVAARTEGAIEELEKLYLYTAQQDSLIRSLTNQIHANTGLKETHKKWTYLIILFAFIAIGYLTGKIKRIKDGNNNL